ncbi:GNAT family N-acetyltransferase [Phytobacter sp. V91]|uniref:GNAT family N-acetyltransferase n=1 Tax=Phytobacter sp. V91 TaxID=3369425 RepID=UPI003F60E143
MILSTPRLTLSPFSEADWPFFLAMRQSPDVMRYMGEIATEQDIRTLFNMHLHDQHSFVIRDRAGEALGDIGLHISTEHPQEADVGYSIAPFAQGKGFASEALAAIQDYAFGHTSITALNAWVLADNHGSVRVVEKLGFVRVQMLEKAFTINSVDYDDWVYRLEKEA